MVNNAFLSPVLFVDIATSRHTRNQPDDVTKATPTLTEFSVFLFVQLYLPVVASSPVRQMATAL